MRTKKRHHRILIGRILLASIFSITLTPFLPSQVSSDAATLQVMVRDSAGQPVAEALVSLLAQDASQTLRSRTDSQGICRLTNLRPGTYSLRAEATGYSASTVASLSLAAKETRSVDLALNAAKMPPPQLASSPPASPATPAPQFFDPPHFTVSGVTDATSIGGHGSDAVARTRESLAKDTVSLGKAAPAPVEAATESSLRREVARDPSSLAANRGLGEILVADGKPGEALPYLERATVLTSGQSPQNQAELHHLLANVHEKLGQSLKAVREYQRAAELDPSEPYLFDWGSELLLHHAPEPALEVFRKGNRLFPQSSRMLMALGAAWFASGSFDQAVHYICQASDLNPADPVPYHFLAKMQSTQTLTSDELVEKLRRFVALRPDDAAADYDFAVALWKQPKNRQDPALIAQVDSLLRTAVHLDPKFDAAHLQLGILHSEQKDFTDAISEYRQALQSDSQLTDLQKTDHRKTDFQKTDVPNTGPQMTDLQIEEAHYRLAQAYREIGETTKAKAELQLYEQFSKQSAERADRQRREIGQFVYTLRDQTMREPAAPH